MLYIQKSVSVNAGNCSHRGRKIQKYSGEEYLQTPPPPTIKCDTTPNFLLPTNHLSFLHTRYSMVPFCICPPPPTDKFLKKCPGAFKYGQGAKPFAGPTYYFDKLLTNILKGGFPVLGRSSSQLAASACMSTFSQSQCKAVNFN